MPSISEQLEKLTKVELLVLLRNSGAVFHITEREIRLARHQVINNRAKKMADEAIADMDKWQGKVGAKARIEWLKASMRCDRAFELYDKANKILTGPSRTRRNGS